MSLREGAGGGRFCFTNSEHDEKARRRKDCPVGFLSVGCLQRTGPERGHSGAKPFAKEKDSMYDYREPRWAGSIYVSEKKNGDRR